MRNKIIAVVNQKGGTGKTTTTINLGSALSRLKKKVLLIDLDPQANLSYSLGIEDSKESLAEVLAGELSIDQAIISKNGLHILPGSVGMVDVELGLVNQPEREFYLKNLLSTLPYDYILIDAPPSLSLLALNALAASHEIIIPLQLEVLTFRGLTQILETIQQVKDTVNPALKIAGILMVMYDKRRKLTLELEKYLKDNIDENIFESVIHSNVKIAEAPSFGLSVIDYDPSCVGSKDYIALAKELNKKNNLKKTNGLQELVR